MLLGLIKDLFFDNPSSRGAGALLPTLDGDFHVALAHHHAGRLGEAEEIYRAILQARPHDPDANHNLGVLLLQAGRTEEALLFLQSALKIDPTHREYWQNVEGCQVQLPHSQYWISLDRREGVSHAPDGEKAKEQERFLVVPLLDRISVLLDQSKYVEAARRRFPGPIYLDWLKWLHHAVQPATYVEIGVESGLSLQFAQKFTKSVGIDPAFNVIAPQESWVKLFRLTSDDFFARHNLTQVLEAKSVDMAFIDGLHTFDQALKDFINIEHYAHPETVVAFHDTFPVTAVTAERISKTIFSLGDTWKVVSILKEMRPDLKILTIPTFPSGLTLVTGLDPSATVLSDEFVHIVERWMNVDGNSYIANMDAHLNVATNDFGVVSQLLGW